MILVSSAIIVLFDYFVLAESLGLTVWQIILYVAVSVVAVIVIDGIFATLVRWTLPQKLFGVEKKGFAASRKTCLFYEKLGVKRWKDKVIELGAFTGFRKNRIYDPTNNEYVGRYIVEANYGIAVHLTGVVFGFLVMLVFPEFWYCIGLPVGIVNAVMNYMPLIILRYNLPKLHTLYRINEKRAKKRQKNAAENVGGDPAENPKDANA